ncbi:Hpt domain-containing protein [Roseomonas sp. CCTCC AB2023176]|uniref:Hpt domain-containing protein n=1 Tax=Roseomonas sp. CCTCC AB2023176 TaxID=3342640 RepID=UPI0035DA4F58
MSALDPEVARSLAADLPHDVFVSIVRTFEQDLARLVREMVEAAKVSNEDGYRRAAHGLAGAAGSIGAKRLEALAREAMRYDDVMPPAQRLRDIGAEARAALTELAALSA